MGEIADALRKANQPVDGSDASDASKVEVEVEAGTNVVPRHSEETTGEVTAAMNRAKEEASTAEDTGDLGASERSGHDATDKRSEAEISTALPNTLSRVIFHVERHRHLCLRLRTEVERGSARSLAIVSANRNEGKTVVACNIAASIAALFSERSVALVDLDLRNPSLAREFQVEASMGIEQVLTGRAKLEQICIRLLNPEIDLYPAAQPHRAAHELLVLPAFETFIRDLEERYTAVIIDTPPTLLVPDSTLIMRSAGYCVAVARAGATRAHRFQEMLDRLPAEKVLGKVLNDVPVPRHSQDDDYYYYANDESE